MNQMLYSVYSWPNTILAMVGGLLIDKYLGLQRAILLFSGTVCAGAFLFYLGVRFINYPILLLGRVLFGFGGESLGVAQSAYIARWFCDDYGLPLAFCISIFAMRVGASFNFLFSPIIARM
uniref:Lysosomal dipeptide transporter MFSD1 n=1 Tax=Lygus hesperus TaxID=30085 RepID=A0A0A9XAR9_LYGHE